MATRKVKFTVSVKELKLEFEGTQLEAHDVQHGLQQTLGGLLNTPARLLGREENAQPVGRRPMAVVDAVPAGHDNGNRAEPAGEGNGERQKQPRQRKGRGPSIAKLLADLKQEGYFAQARASGEVLTHLKDSKGHTLRSSNVMTELQRMVQKDEGEASKLYRWKNSDGAYIYKDSPFHDSPGSPTPPEQPAP